ASGDTWVIVAVVDSNGAATLDTPSNFESAHAQVDGSDGGYPSVRTFWKIAGASETAVSVSASNGVYVLWCASIRVTGAHASSPIGNIATTSPSGSGTTLDAPDVPIQNDGSGAILVAGGIISSGTAAFTAPSGTSL